MWCQPGVAASVNPPRIRFGACDPFRARAGYKVGTLTGSDKALVTLLDSEHVTPDQLVEMLLPAAVALPLHRYARKLVRGRVDGVALRLRAVRHQR